jgi:hypothetical protein
MKEAILAGVIILILLFILLIVIMVIYVISIKRINNIFMIIEQEQEASKSNEK